jgi:hypothetical protein
LFPIRVETRFVNTAGAGGGRPQLWVRFYPDDCLVDTFEPTLSEAELLRVRQFWIAWASAGSIEDQERGALAGAGRLLRLRPCGVAHRPVPATQPECAAREG